MNQYYVYILTTRKNTVLYTGVTSDLVQRVSEHKERQVEGFTKTYCVNKLVYYEVFGDINEAIRREKRLKKWYRDWKIDLIGKTNPDWHDLWDEISDSQIYKH